MFKSHPRSTVLFYSYIFPTGPIFLTYGEGRGSFIVSFLFPSWVVGASRPAQECRRSVKKALDSNNYVMYIRTCLLCMRCSIPILFTCIAVISCPVVWEGVHVKYEYLRQTTSYWVGQNEQGRCKMEGSWQETQTNPRTRPRWMYLRIASRSSCSSMYKLYKSPIQCIDHAWLFISLQPV